MSKQNCKVELINSSRSKPNTAKTKDTLLSKKSKNQKKTSLFEDSSNLWWDVFVFSKIAFLKFFFGFGGKINISI